MSVDGVGVEETYYHELVREFLYINLFVVYMAGCLMEFGVMGWSEEDFRFHLRECNKQDSLLVVVM